MQNIGTSYKREGDWRSLRQVTETFYLKQLKASHRARARAAMRWRPRFLECLSMATGVVFAAKAARVSYNTFRLHQRNDPEFAEQVREVEAQGAELLHYACFQRAVEGNLEPIYFQGKVVGNVRKFDTRLQIEFLRAHLPELFRMPGAPQVNINSGQQILVLDAATRHQIQVARTAALRAQRQEKQQEQPALPVAAGGPPSTSPLSPTTPF
jgi:hypothetical protein